MTRPDKVTIGLEDGRQILVQLRDPSLWRTALRMIFFSAGISSILIGGLLLWHGYNTSAVYAAVSGLGLMTMGKE